MNKSLSELAAHVGGEVVGDPSIAISGVNGLVEAGPGDLSFFGNPKYRSQFEATRAGAVLVGADVAPVDGRTVVRVPNPHLAFAKISTLFHHPPRKQAGISPQAWVHPEASVHPSATVMANASVDRGATVGARAVLYPGVYVGEDASVGEDAVLYPNVTVRERCTVGARVILHPSAVIGADGFGFAFNPEVPEHYKIPQAGTVRIEDDVEIGACSCVDRATLGETVVGRGTKVDNLVQIAHNVKIGPLTLLCAQVGIAGSTEVGTGVVMGGQVGVVGHLRIGDLVKIGSQAGVAHDVEDGQIVSGNPAFPHKDWLRAAAAFTDLPQLAKEVRALRKRLEALEKKNEEGQP